MNYFRKTLQSPEYARFWVYQSSEYVSGSEYVSVYEYARVLNILEFKICQSFE